MILHTNERQKREELAILLPDKKTLNQKLSKGQRMTSYNDKRSIHE